MLYPRHCTLQSLSRAWHLHAVGRWHDLPSRLPRSWWCIKSIAHSLFAGDSALPYTIAIFFVIIPRNQTPHSTSPLLLQTLVPAGHPQVAWLPTPMLVQP